MQLKNKKVTVFCSASNAVSEEYKKVAQELGSLLVKHSCHLIYGGNKNGLMCIVAETVLNNGGKVTGIIPKFMKEKQWQDNRLTDEQLIITGTMTKRKEKLISQVDIIIVLAGGVGTLEEASQAINMNRFGKITTPIIFINTNSFYSELLHWLNKTIDQRFMRKKHQEIWHSVDCVAKLLSFVMVIYFNIFGI